MRKIIFLIVVIFSSCNLLAQTNYYKGEWTQVNRETIFTGLLKLEIKDTVATGEIIWIFVATDSSSNELVNYYKDRKGKSGIEYVKGIFSIKTRDIHFQGISKTDPDLIIDMDKYLLKLSADKQVIYGRTLSNGENNGLVYFYKTSNASAEKQFNMLKSKIISNSSDHAILFLQTK